MAFRLQRPLRAVWICAEQRQRSGSCSSKLWHLFLLLAPFIPVIATSGLLWLGVVFSFPSDSESKCKLVHSELLPSLLSCLFSTTHQVMNFISYLHGILCLSPALCSVLGFSLGMRTLRQQFCSSLFLFLQPASSVYCLERRTTLNCLEQHPYIPVWQFWDCSVVKGKPLCRNANTLLILWRSPVSGRALALSCPKRVSCI